MRRVKKWKSKTLIHVFTNTQRVRVQSKLLCVWCVSRYRRDNLLLFVINAISLDHLPTLEQIAFPRVSKIATHRTILRQGMSDELPVLQSAYNNRIL